MPRLLHALMLALVGALIASAAWAVPSEQDETAIAAMKTLGRTQEQTWDLGVLDKSAWCKQRYGVEVVGFDYPTQAFYCRTTDRWLKVETGPACELQYGARAIPDSNKERCSRYGGPDPGPPNETAAPPVIRIEPGTVDKPYDPQNPPGGKDPLAAVRGASVDAVSQPGVADQPVASQGLLGGFNKLPTIVRVMIAGGGFMLIGLWAGGWAIRMMP